MAVINLQDYRYLTLEAGNTHSSSSFSNLWANGSDTFSAENRDSLGILSWSCRHSSPHHGSSRMRSGWLRGDRGSMWADPLSERPQSWASELWILHTTPLSESDTDYSKSFGELHEISFEGKKWLQLSFHIYRRLIPGPPRTPKSAMFKPFM